MGGGGISDGDLVECGGGGGGEDAHPHPSPNPSRSRQAVIGLPGGGCLVGEDPTPHSVPQRLIVLDFAVFPHPHPCACPRRLLLPLPTLRASTMPGADLSLGADIGRRSLS